MVSCITAFDGNAARHCSVLAKYCSWTFGQVYVLVAACSQKLLQATLLLFQAYCIMYLVFYDITIGRTRSIAQVSSLSCCLRFHKQLACRQLSHAMVCSCLQRSTERIIFRNTVTSVYCEVQGVLPKNNLILVFVCLSGFAQLLALVCASSPAPMFPNVKD